MYLSTVDIKLLSAKILIFNHVRSERITHRAKKRIIKYIRRTFHHRETTTYQNIHHKYFHNKNIKTTYSKHLIKAEHSLIKRFIHIESKQKKETKSFSFAHTYQTSSLIQFSLQLYKQALEIFFNKQVSRYLRVFQIKLSKYSVNTVFLEIVYSLKQSQKYFSINKSSDT